MAQILIVDTCEFVRDWSRLMSRLEADDHHVELCTTERRFLDMLSDRAPEVLVSHLVQMQGNYNSVIDLLDRHHPNNRSRRIVMTSVMAEGPAFREWCAPVDAFVLDREQLPLTIEQLLRRPFALQCPVRCEGR